MLRVGIDGFPIACFNISQEPRVDLGIAVYVGRVFAFAGAASRAHTTTAQCICAACLFRNLIESGIVLNLRLNI